jgi:hypothetical protein
VPIDNLLTDARNNLYTAFAAVDTGMRRDGCLQPEAHQGLPGGQSARSRV